jgi:TonB family protein
MEWMIRANLNLVLFWVIFHLVLHFTNRLKTARVYLLLAPVLSLAIPQLLMLQSSVTATSFSYLLEPAVISAGATTVPATSYSLADMVNMIYWTGAGLSLGVSLTGLIMMTFFPKRTTTAYSFFYRIFIPPAETQAAQMMRMHEEAHVRMWHSADVLYYQLVKAVFWFNPVAYKLAASLKEVHEFSADDYALRQVGDKVAYCELLLDETFGRPSHPLINPFHSRSTLFNRITMITRTQQQPVSWWKYAAILPVFAGIMFLSLTPSEALAQDNKEKVFQGKDMPEVMPEFKGGQGAMMTFLGKEIRYPADARKEKVEGKVVLRFIVQKDGSISDVQNLKESADPRLVKEAMRVVAAMPAWTPGQHEGKPVAVAYTLPVMFKLD